jgi:hypothetical protein
VINQNVYNRMAARGVNFNDPRVMRRLHNRSFQANQGTLAKGQWTNKPAMRESYAQQFPQTGGPTPAAQPRQRPNRWRGKKQKMSAPTNVTPANTGMGGQQPVIDPADPTSQFGGYDPMPGMGGGKEFGGKGRENQNQNRNS